MKEVKSKNEDKKLNEQGLKEVKRKVRKDKVMKLNLDKQEGKNEETEEERQKGGRKRRWTGREEVRDEGKDGEE